MTTIGSRIKKLRKQQNLTLKELSEKVGISISFLSDIENGRSNPSLERLKQLAKALNTTIGYIIGEEHDHTIIPTIEYNRNNVIKKHRKRIKDLFTFLGNMKFDEILALELFLEGLIARRKLKNHP